MIRFRNVTKEYPRTGEALADVSFHIRKGEFAFLTGHSGAGKTTLLRLVHFQTRPSKGQVQVSRYNSERIRRRQIPEVRRRVGYVFQDFKLLERLTAAENVAFALEVTGTARRDIDGKVQRLLSQVGLAAKARSRPEELSGGERQRVVIARALATDPLVLLADEPTGNLDARAAAGVFQLFRTLNRLGMAVLMATHDGTFMRENPEIRVLELEHGRLVFDSGSEAAETAVSDAKAGARTSTGESPTDETSVRSAVRPPGGGAPDARPGPPAAEQRTAPAVEQRTASATDARTPHPTEPSRVPGREEAP